MIHLLLCVTQRSCSVSFICVILPFIFQSASRVVTITLKTFFSTEILFKVKFNYFILFYLWLMCLLLPHISLWLCSFFFPPLFPLCSSDYQIFFDLLFCWFFLVPIHISAEAIKWMFILIIVLFIKEFPFGSFYKHFLSIYWYFLFHDMLSPYLLSIL